MVRADWLTLSSDVILTELSACRIAKGTVWGRKVVILKLLNSSFFFLSRQNQQVRQGKMCVQESISQELG